MPGKRQPTAVIKANGRKHMTKAEEAERLASEVQAPPAEDFSPPKWLPEKLHQDFSAMAKKLAELGLYSDFDQDVLGQFFLSRDRWQAADKRAASAIRANDNELARHWTTVQGTYFKQTRQCAESMGLSVTARCRLVVPAGMDDGEDDGNPFLTLIKGGKAANG